ncbi:MAG: efflux RND transporter periplasmic adaptor subunit [Sphingomonadaceae bacterium]|nr:efflux RND transporter periplasmic adaptor subunit [Sphingomonadaceae bacterium]
MIKIEPVGPPRGARRTAALLALAVLGACGNRKQSPPPPSIPEVGFVTMRAEAVPLTIELPGRTAAIEIADVRPQVSGVIQARQFREGSLVRKGQTLYQIDPSLYRAAVSQAAANLQAAQAARESAATLAQRYEPLARMQAVSAQDLTNAQAQAKQAAATVAQQRAALETARINLAFTRVPAPITGRIGRSLTTTGALVTANQATPLAQIERLDPIFVDLQQSSADLLALRRALAKGGALPASTGITIRLEDGSIYPHVGRLQFAETIVDPATGTVTLRARIPNPDEVLLPGMYARAMFAQAVKPDAILVPQAGLARDPSGRATVILIGPGDKAVLREVSAERTIGDRWLVTKGLAPGDRVIVEGLQRVKPGQTVRPVQAEMANSPRSRPLQPASRG